MHRGKKRDMAIYKTKKERKKEWTKTNMSLLKMNKNHRKSIWNCGIEHKEKKIDHLSFECQFHSTFQTKCIITNNWINGHVTRGWGAKRWGPGRQHWYWSRQLTKSSVSNCKSSPSVKPSSALDKSNFELSTPTRNTETEINWARYACHA